MENVLQIHGALVYQFTKSFSTSELSYKCFSFNDIFSMTLLLHFFCGTFTLCMEITLQLHFVLVVNCDVFFIMSQLRVYLFNVVTFFDDVRITLYFGRFELCTEITL